MTSVDTFVIYIGVLRIYREKRHDICINNIKPFNIPKYFKQRFFGSFIAILISWTRRIALVLFVFQFCQ